MTDKVIFLDFDGVIRVDQHDGGWLMAGTGPAFCSRRIGWLVEVCENTGAKIVVSSDWRRFSDEAGYLASKIGRLAEHLHEDHVTPVTGTRHKEVAQWLDEHPEVRHFAILEDQLRLFAGCNTSMYQRIVLCSNRFGLVPELVKRIYEKLAL